MEAWFRNRCACAIAILIVFFLFPHQVVFSEPAKPCEIDKSISSLFGNDLGREATMEQLIRLLAITHGLGGESYSELSTKNLLDRLKSLGLFPENVAVDFDASITKGEISVVLVKTLLEDKGSLVEGFLISGFSSKEACFRVALRNKLLPPGTPDDKIDLRELAAILLATAAITISDPHPEADRTCIDRFTTIIVDTILSIDELNAILQRNNSLEIKTMLAM